MTIELDGILRLGDVAVAALAERSVRAKRVGRAIAGHASKRPVAVLIRQAGETRAFAPDGAPIPLDEFDRRHPGQRERFERRAEG